MAYNYEYPYVDSQDYNDDWLLHAMQEYKAEWAKILEEITNKWGEYQEQIDKFKEQVNQEIANFENSLTQQWTQYQQETNQSLDQFKNALTEQWTQYQQETNQSLDQFKNALTEQWSDVEQEWQDYKKTLTADWTAYQQTQSQLWQEFKTGIEATQDAFQTEVLADISNLESAWATYKTTVNNALSAQDTKIAEYKAYMDNYFSNLDLTTEISNKIDGMVSDGTMDTIINTEVFNGLNAKIGGLYKANAIKIMIGDKMTVYRSTVTIVDVYRRILGLSPQQLFAYLSSTTSFWLDDNGDGECDGVTMLRSIAGNMTAQQALNVSDIYLITQGNFSGIPAHNTALPAMMQQLYAYIKSTFLNATPHIICAAIPPRNPKVRDGRLMLYRNLIRNVSDGTCHNLYQICYNTNCMHDSGQYTEVGMELLARNIHEITNGGEMYLATAANIKLFGSTKAYLSVIPEKNGLRITSTGDRDNSGQIEHSDIVGSCIIGRIESSNVNTYYPINMDAPANLFVADTSSENYAFVPGTINVKTISDGTQNVYFQALKTLFDFSNFNSFNIAVDTTVPWQFF